MAVLGCELPLQCSLGCLSPRTPVFRLRGSCTPWHPLPRMEHSLGPLLHHVWARSGHPSVQPERLLPTGDPAPPLPAGALPACWEPPTPEHRLLEPLGMEM